MTLEAPDTKDPRQAEERAAARDRDIQELREDLAGQAEGEGVSRAQLKELILLEGGADPEDLERPYLEAVPDQYAARLTLFEWLGFALDRAGGEATLEAIDYYVDIGWLGESAAEALRDHVRVFQDGLGGGQGTFDTPDHLVSLVYVARLASMT